MISPKDLSAERLAEAVSEFLEHVTWMRDHASRRITQEVDSPIGKRLAIPADSQLNAYIQGQRDTCTELLARWREFSAALAAPKPAGEPK